MRQFPAWRRAARDRPFARLSRAHWSGASQKACIPSRAGKLPTTLPSRVTQVELRLGRDTCLGTPTLLVCETEKAASCARPTVCRTSTSGIGSVDPTPASLDRTAAPSTCRWGRRADIPVARTLPEEKTHSTRAAFCRIKLTDMNGVPLDFTTPSEKQKMAPIRHERGAGMGDFHRASCSSVVTASGRTARLQPHEFWSPARPPPSANRMTPSRFHVPPPADGRVAQNPRRSTRDADGLELPVSEEPDGTGRQATRTGST